MRRRLTPSCPSPCARAGTTHTLQDPPAEAGIEMENLNIPLPDLSEEQQDIFRRAFIADDNYLANHEKMSQSFWESLVKSLAATDPPILATDEKNNLLNRCSVLPGACAACLKAIETKGVMAMAVLYLLLKSSNPPVYQQLPSSKGKDEKLKLLKRLERNLMDSQEDKKAENKLQKSMDGGTHGIPAEVVPYGDSGLSRREDSISDAYGNKNIHPQWWTVRWMGIRKDDEFFHFVILCFAIGALLVCYYYYKVYRLRSVLNTFVPLIDKLRPTGMRKAA
ncbi:transmembrane protein 40 isoform X2 [Coturnix japonica]|uniref:transmembrane protein 40 isoform X2 n=1 Tax=Coturnix japonica TaxID=93934 RepID=UPI0013A5E899|nr:transmembrane protein 40 isoform X2 [Coturnix japonica]